jgi:hypothetical protein
LELFPDRDDYRFIASHGTQGSKRVLVQNDVVQIVVSRYDPHRSW